VIVVAGSQGQFARLVLLPAPRVVLRNWDVAKYETQRPGTAKKRRLIGDHTRSRKGGQEEMQVGVSLQAQRANLDPCHRINTSVCAPPFSMCHRFGSLRDPDESILDAQTPPTMGAVISSFNGSLVGPVLAVVLYAAYRAALPKPLPYIPCNQDAAGKLLGDLPKMMGYMSRTKRVFVGCQQGVSGCPMANKNLRPVLTDLSDNTPREPHLSDLHLAIVVAVAGHNRSPQKPGYPTTAY